MKQRGGELLLGLMTFGCAVASERFEYELRLTGVSADRYGAETVSIDSVSGVFVSPEGIVQVAADQLGFRLTITNQTTVPLLIDWDRARIAGLVGGVARVESGSNVYDELHTLPSATVGLSPVSRPLRVLENRVQQLSVPPGETGEAYLVPVRGSTQPALTRDRATCREVQESEVILVIPVDTGGDSTTYRLVFGPTQVRLLEPSDNGSERICQLLPQ